MHSLVLTDISSGWTVAAAMVVREQVLVTETLMGIRAQLPFHVVTLTTQCSFINETR